MTQKKWTGPAAIIVTIVLAVAISAGYYQFAARQIRQESVSHLEEIYTQISRSFHVTITKNWRLLHSWRNYITEKADAAPEEFSAFIQEMKDDWHITAFYFLSENGEYMTARGERGYLDLGENLERLVEDREDIVVDGTLPSAQQITVFAAPIQPGEYHGFRYTAIGISFNSSDMTESLSISAFNGESDCFITYPDGRILFSSQSREGQSYNLLVYLREQGTVTGGGDAATVARDWKEGTARAVIWKQGNTSYYLCYQPVDFSDWMLVSIAPTEIVNASMNGFTVVTLSVMGLLFAVIGICVVSFVVLGNRRRMREMNREIDSRERLFDLLTENTEDIFVLFSPKDFAAGYVSPNAERVLGIRPEKIRGNVRPLLFGTGEEPGGRLTPELLEGISMGGLWAGEREILHAQTREPRWFKLLVHRCSLEGEEQFILMLSDRTQERKMNGVLQAALHTAKAANEAKSNFLSNMSHDIRTPMNAIVGFSVLLDKNAEDPERVREYTRKISSSSQHLLSLINDILDMSKIESGKTALNMSEFSLPEMLDELYSMILPQAQAKDQSFELYTEGDLPEQLLGDKLRLNQVLINLLSNAVKYTQEGGRISLTVQELERNAGDRAHLRFVVADDGFGMTEGFVETIFDPFAREVTEQTKGIQGTGLGMAITKNIVTLMGGTLTVESKLNKGSTFTIEIELTAVSRERDKAAAEDDPQEEISLEGLKVLAAEDNELNAEILLELLDMEGVRCEIVPNGREAVERFARAEPGEFDVIFMDVQMPVMDGYEATRAIRAGSHPEAKTIPIIAMTANAFEEDIQNALAAGMNAHTAKPIDMERLKSAVVKLWRKGQTK